MENRTTGMPSSVRCDSRRRSRASTSVVLRPCVSSGSSYLSNPSSSPKAVDPSFRRKRKSGRTSRQGSTGSENAGWISDGGMPASIITARAIDSPPLSALPSAKAAARRAVAAPRLDSASSSTMNFRTSRSISNVRSSPSATASASANGADTILSTAASTSDITRTPSTQVISCGVMPCLLSIPRLFDGADAFVTQ